ncbi:MAG TPA: hypothetical protein VLI42_08985, partial [Chthoniobacterales bacterium]|nr:hypothetical protein [Chthoniobacterales bacterium]
SRRQSGCAAAALLVRRVRNAFRNPEALARVAPVAADGARGNPFVRGPQSLRALAVRVASQFVQLAIRLSA